GYEMRWGGRCQLQFAADAARIFIAAARSGHGGAAVFNLGGPSAHASEVVSAIEAAAPEAAGRITFDDVQLPFPEEMEAGDLEDVVGPIEWTTLREGTRQTIELYRARLSVQRSSSTGVVSPPSPSISIGTSSPSFSSTGGSRNTPTPAGVPVAIRSPGSSVIVALAYAMISATVKIMFAVVESCITSPFSTQRTPRAWGSGTSAANTSC